MYLFNSNNKLKREHRSNRSSKTNSVHLFYFRSNYLYFTVYTMVKLERISGILVHISSLPGPNGIGDIGKEAYKFVDFLYECNQKTWQVSKQQNGLA
jgi:hypothetical protein